MKEKKVPIKTIHLFRPLDKMLIRLLKSLTAEQWEASTVAKRWTVKDIAAHLLDTNIRTISILRDGYFGDKPANIASYQDLVDYLNKLNHSWTDASRRLSPPLLIELLEKTGRQFHKELKALPPYEPAVFPVAWAGQDQSPNWFHIAREYTEKFVHQQQIRDAVGSQALLTKKMYRPFLDSFMQALPYSYRNTMAEIGTVVTVIVKTKAGGRWNIIKDSGGWQLIKKIKQSPAAIVRIEPDIAWKLFSKSVAPADVTGLVEIEGNQALGKVALGMVSVMA